jgi:hypothetical protein
MIDEKILLVTEPDDVLQEGYRILLFDLTPDQNLIVSNSLGAVDFEKNLIVYSWKSGNSAEWLFDKLPKCQMTIFNADSQEESLVGYLAAKNRSYYFGNLRALKLVNNSVLYDVESITTILERNLKHE